ncbi:MAG: thiamine diphosphokinase [Spirochaetaceae bacterium]|nr:thiamine diphosphokinase [Spirochaetaceae bacterium]
MKGVLVLGGEHPSAHITEQHIRDADLVVAADSGFDFLWENGLDFDYIVGDMDSTRYGHALAEMPSEKLIIASTEKDETDTELGLQFLKERGIDFVTMIGGGGGRLDHLLGIVALFDREIRPDEWYTQNEGVVSIDRSKSFRNLKGKTVSLFPAGTELCRMQSHGLKWPLDNLEWKRGSAGISNVVKSDEVTIVPKSGRLLFIYPL